MAAGTWPLQSHLELGALPTAVPCARLHARQVLWEWGLDKLAETAELLVSELVTNAVKATAGRDRLPPVRLWLSSDKERLLIEVWDADPRPPVPASPAENGIPALTNEGGRGLFLVAALSQRWSWYAAREWGGKVVWSELQLNTSQESHHNGRNCPREGASPTMSSPAPHSTAVFWTESARESAAVPAGAPGMALPLRPQRAGVNAKHWVPPDPETMRRVKAALARL